MYVVMPVARNMWQQASTLRPAASARRRIIRKTSTRDRPRVVSSPLRPRVERKRGLFLIRFSPAASTYAPRYTSRLWCAGISCRLPPFSSARFGHFRPSQRALPRGPLPTSLPSHRHTRASGCVRYALSNPAILELLFDHLVQSAANPIEVQLMPQPSVLLKTVERAFHDVSGVEARRERARREVVGVSSLMQKNSRAWTLDSLPRCPLL
jgi:hypothetical protein